MFPEDDEVDEVEISPPNQKGIKELELKYPMQDGKKMLMERAILSIRKSPPPNKEEDHRVHKVPSRTENFLRKEDNEVRSYASAPAGPRVPRQPHISRRRPFRTNGDVSIGSAQKKQESEEKRAEEKRAEDKKSPNQAGNKKKREKKTAVQLFFPPPSNTLEDDFFAKRDDEREKNTTPATSAATSETDLPIAAEDTRTAEPDSELVVHGDEPEPESAPPSETEVRAGPEAEAEPEAEFENSPPKKVEAEAGVEPETEPVTEPEAVTAETEAEAEAETEPKAEAEKDPYTLLKSPKILRT